MATAMKPFASLLLVAAVALPLSSAAQLRSARAEPHYQPAAPKSAEVRLLAAKPVSISLPLPAVQEKARLEQGLRAAAIGFPRALAPLETESRLQSTLRWQALPGGARVAAVRITSHGANAVRL